MESFCCVGDHATRNLWRGRSPELLGATHHLAQRLAVQVFHRNPVRVFVLAELEDRGNVRMRNARDDARLVDEHIYERLVFDQVRMNSLDGDPFLKSAWTVHAREVDACHASDADLLHYPIAAEEMRAS
jgi:hypothetical protein